MPLSEYFPDCFNAVQELIAEGWILAGHDISAGGLVTTLLEMCFANREGGIHINLHDLASRQRHRERPSLPRILAWSFR